MFRYKIVGDPLDGAENPLPSPRKTHHLANHPLPPSRPFPVPPIFHLGLLDGDYWNLPFTNPTLQRSRSRTGIRYYGHCGHGFPLLGWSIGRSTLSFGAHFGCFAFYGRFTHVCPQYLAGVCVFLPRHVVVRHLLHAHFCLVYGHDLSQHP